MSDRIEELIITLPENVKSEIRKEIENIKFLERMDVKLGQCITTVNEIVENRNKIINNTGHDITSSSPQYNVADSSSNVFAPPSVVDLSYLGML